MRPFLGMVLEMLKKFDHLIFFEEHVRMGGLTAAVTNLFIDNKKGEYIFIDFRDAHG